VLRGDEGAHRLDVVEVLGDVGVDLLGLAEEEDGVRALDGERGADLVRASWKFADSGRVRSPRPRVSRIFISPRGPAYEYQVGCPVSERTEPTAAIGSPKMALISDDLPAPRRPRIISFGGLASIRSSLRISSSFRVERPSASGIRSIARSASSEIAARMEVDSDMVLAS
jgi:hypothetical protein